MKSHALRVAAVLAVFTAFQNSALADDGDVHVSRVDFNKDGVVALDDIDFVMEQVEVDALIDLDGDGDFDIDDKNIFLGMLGCEWLPGDYNMDGDVTAADLTTFLGAYGTFNPVIDLTGDGYVYPADLVLFLYYFSL